MRVVSQTDEQEFGQAVENALAALIDDGLQVPLMCRVASDDGAVLVMCIPGAQTAPPQVLTRQGAGLRRPATMWVTDAKGTTKTHRLEALSSKERLGRLFKVLP